MLMNAAHVYLPGQGRFASRPEHYLSILRLPSALHLETL